MMSQPKTPLTIGILALQGDFQKHADHVRSLDAEALLVRRPEDLEGIDGLIIPGGESTTIGKLLVAFKLVDPLQERLASGLPLFGTCAGLILMAREIDGYDQFRLGTLDVTVTRNAYGRQIESFEAEIPVEEPLHSPVRGVFIRAPRIIRLGDGVEVLATYEGDPVMVQQKNLLAASFHPELTENREIHRYFIGMIQSRREIQV